MADTFTIRLADLTVFVAALHAQTRELCRDYLCGDDIARDISVETSQADIDYERELDGLGAFGDPYYETLAVYRKIAEELPRFGRMLVHGSAVAIGGEAWLFMAPSGTGKSTHTRWWREVFADERPVMINDDKPIVRLCDDGVLVYGTPWDGKERLSTNTCVRLAGIGLLERGETDCVERLAAGEGIPEIMSHAYRPVGRAGMLATIETVQQLSMRVPLFKVRVTNSADAARTVRDAMTR